MRKSRIYGILYKVASFSGNLIGSGLLIFGIVRTQLLSLVTERLS